jgi:hypothetical protein
MWGWFAGIPRRTDVPYSQRMLALEPLLYYPLSQTAGTTVEDLGDNGYNGTASGVTWGADGIGDGLTAATFDGVNAYISFPVSFLGVHNYRDTGTLLVWVKRDSGAAGDRYALRLANTSLFSPYDLAVHSDWHETDQWVVRIFRQDTSGTVGLYALLTPGEWTCVVGTWDAAADALKLYINGELAGTTSGLSAAGSATLTSSDTQIGASVYAKAPLDGWAGDLAHVALFTEVLNDDVIAGLAGV